MGKANRSGSHPGVAAIVLGAFLLAEFAVRPALALVFPGLGGYPRWAASSALEVTICLVAAAALLRGGPITALRGLGLWASPLTGFAVGLLATAPLPAIYAATGSFDSGVDPVRLTFLAGISPFAEEVLFRGFAFWLLYRLAGWNFWAAVLVPAVFFGTGHLHQAGDLGSAAGIFAITALGGMAANAARALVIALSVVLTVWRQRIPGFRHAVAAEA